jgi:hypothetical protein
MLKFSFNETPEHGILAGRIETALLFNPGAVLPVHFVHFLCIIR